MNLESTSSSMTSPLTLDARRDARLNRLSRQALAAAGLFEKRPELRDVATWSDGVIESVLWSA